MNSSMEQVPAPLPGASVPMWVPGSRSGRITPATVYPSTAKGSPNITALGSCNRRGGALYGKNRVGDPETLTRWTWGFAVSPSTSSRADSVEPPLDLKEPTLRIEHFSPALYPTKTHPKPENWSGSRVCQPVLQAHPTSLDDGTWGVRR